MKKLIILIASTLLITTSSFLVIACKTQQKSNKFITTFNDRNLSNTDIKIENDDNDEKSSESVSKEIDKEKIENKKIVKETPKKEEKKVQDQQSEEKQKYVLQRSRENNFSLTKEYGLKHADFTWNNQEKWGKWRKDSRNTSLASLIGELTVYYFEISKYSSVVELEREFESKLNKNNKYKSFEDFIEKLDRTITEYEKEKDKIWNQLESIQ
ncbi:lipoprotein [Mycoplasma mycoides]|uniref:lipoprotein n=1 Tax=Mycoplasma mycoides TaxID=2102 RepID=UPI0022409AE8|nr:lipoprotein [Mycoplasma mycoides]QVK08777.1 lipoprotein [Mycoplasma mycoides subsp. capri]